MDRFFGVFPLCGLIFFPSPRFFPPLMTSYSPAVWFSCDPPAPACSVLLERVSTYHSLFYSFFVLTIPEPPLARLLFFSHPDLSRFAPRARKHPAQARSSFCVPTIPPTAPLDPTVVLHPPDVVPSPPALHQVSSSLLLGFFPCPDQSCLPASLSQLCPSPLLCRPRCCLRSLSPPSE